MLRNAIILCLAGAAAYAAQPMCPCPAGAGVRRTVRTRTVTTASSTSSSANREYTESSIVLPAGTTIAVRLDRSLDTRRDRAGTPFVATVSRPVVRGGEVVVPRGAIARGYLIESKPSGRLKGRAEMALALRSVDIRGRVYRISASGPVFETKGHKGHDAVWIGGGAGTGAAVGAIAGGGIGAAVGAGVGAVAGTTGAFITGKRNLRLAPETQVVFTLRHPVAVRERG
ncbi:MAG TPA: hypothetical protein VKX45_17840 [Bryobacteraceae bacterium]|jgi:hypothetical protein|nr:hypothetical protein [Bryobacteraceae bacterium]